MNLHTALSVMDLESVGMLAAATIAVLALVIGTAYWLHREFSDKLIRLELTVSELKVTSEIQRGRWRRDMERFAKLENQLDAIFKEMATRIGDLNERIEPFALLYDGYSESEERLVRETLNPELAMVSEWRTPPLPRMLADMRERINTLEKWRRS